MQFEPISGTKEVPVPPESNDPSAAELRAWLGELNRLKDEPGAPDEVRVRVLEHIELATVYLGLGKEGEGTREADPVPGFAGFQSDSPPSGRRGWEVESRSSSRESGS